MNITRRQEGCQGKSKSTGDQLYIDKMLLQEIKRRKKNLEIGWINYWKA